MNALVQIHAPPPMSISDIERIALAIAKGKLFGSQDPNAVLTLCLLAQAEGQHPAIAFRDYHIINGKPAKKADAMLRDFITAGGKVKWHALDDTVADATFTHPSGEARIEWTLARAAQAGINTPMWRKYPRQMLRSRVISEGVRTVFPGATSGLYEVGEVQDIVADDAPALIEHAPQAEQHEPEQVKPPRNWGGRYPTKTALKQAMHTHHAELERLGIEGTFDDLEGYLTGPEYQGFIATAQEHAPYYLSGEKHPNSPAEFIQTFDLEQKARDLIAIRGNIPAEVEG